MRVLPLLFVLAPAYGAIGDPCDPGAEPPECGVTEFCVPEGDAGYCSALCPAEGCPDGFYCYRLDGQPDICRRGDGPPELAGFGEACGTGVATCGEDLFCSGTPPDDTYCTSICNGPGTCPQGWSCRPIQGRAGSGCARLNGPPGLGDLCADAEPRCNEGLECRELGGASLCTRGCEDGESCGSGLSCEGGVCAPPAPTISGIGGPCVPGGMPEGCEDGLYCYTQGADAYCTGPCDGANPCPEGYGCVEVAALTGECRRGAETDPIFNPSTIDLGTSPPPPPGDAGTLKVTEPADEGCECGAVPTAPPLLLALIAVRRRRRGARR